MLVSLLIPKFARKCAAGLANFGIGTLADQSSLNWAIVPFTGGSRGSDPAAAVFDFSIGARPKPHQRRPKVAAVIDPRAPSGPRLLTLAACEGRYGGGETIWSLVWRDITPYNLPHPE